ncbi:HTH-type transcriptional activator RhaR [Salmonella enterica subsp. enterica serovar Choleraesuis]|nr:HTH-type transcriptional activator RhaR [Salmonella enterica subsp. enterica serovar Choleraesuis]
MTILTLQKKDFFESPGQPVVVADRLPQQVFADHRHDFYELVLVWRGNGLHILNGHPWRITRGDLFYIRPEDRHSYTSVDNLVLQNILYCPERLTLNYPLEDLIPDSRLRGHWRLSQAGMTPVRQIIQQLSHETMATDALSCRMAETLFLQLLLTLKRHRYQSESGSAQPDETGVERLIGIIAAQMDKPLELAEFCHQQGCSERKLRQSFRQQTGMSISHYQRQIRICRAQYLLHNSTLRISEVAMHCGFEDSNYFSVVFARETGMAPLQWRQQMNAPLVRHAKANNIGGDNDDHAADA